MGCQHGIAEQIVDAKANYVLAIISSGHATDNIALMNKAALNLLKNEKSTKVGIKSKRLKAGWDNDYMLKVLAVGFYLYKSDTFALVLYTQA